MITAGSNPFSTRFIRPGAIPYCFGPQTDREAELERIATAVLSSPATLIVGPHGTGKSTLLCDLRDHLRDRHIAEILLHSPATSDRLAGAIKRRSNGSRVAQLQRNSPPGSLLVIDGMEQMSMWSRWKLLRRAARDRQRILGTSHHVLPGLRPVYQTAACPAVIDSLAMRLVENRSANLKKAVGDELRSRKLTRVTDVRELFFDLYDLVADLPDDTSKSSTSTTT